MWHFFCGLSTSAFLRSCLHCDRCNRGTTSQYRHCVVDNTQRINGSIVNAISITIMIRSDPNGQSRGETTNRKSSLPYFTSRSRSLNLVFTPQPFPFAFVYVFVHLCFLPLLWKSMQCRRTNNNKHSPSGNNNNNKRPRYNRSKKNSARMKEEISRRYQHYWW